MSDKDNQITESLSTVRVGRNKNKPFIIAAIVAGLAIIGMCILAMFLVLAIVGQHKPITATGYSIGGISNSGSASGPGLGSGFGRHGSMGGLRPQVNSANYVSGVVISVNGSSFVIAGNGTQTTVSTTGSTTYVGTTSNSVAVNDTVAAVGTTTSGVFTATTVTVRNITSS